MGAALEVRRVVLGLRRQRAWASVRGGVLLELRVQPLVKAWVAGSAHLSKETVEPSEVPIPASKRSPRRTRSCALAAARRDATVRSGIPIAAAISRLVKPCRWRSTR